PSPGCTIMGPIWTSNCGGHTCVTVPPYVRATSRSFIRVLLLEGRLDNHGFSGLRLRTTRQRDATRSHTAMRGNCTTEDEPRDTASYCMLVQPEESLDLFAVVCQERWGDGLDADHAPAGIALGRIDSA